MFPNKERINEDLERIRRANISSSEAIEEDKASEIEKTKVKERLKELTFKDYLAMIIAVFSIIIPYLLILVGVLVLFVFLFYLVYLK